MAPPGPQSNTTAERLARLRALQAAGTPGLQGAIAALEAQLQHEIRQPEERSWRPPPSAHGHTGGGARPLRSRTPSRSAAAAGVAPTPQLAAPQRQGIAGRVVFLVFFGLAGAVLAAAAAAPSSAAPKPPPRIGPDGLGEPQAAGSSAAGALSARRECERDLGPLNNTASGAAVCRYAAERAAQLQAAPVSDPTDYTLVVTAYHVSESLRHSAATWRDAGLFAHATLKAVVVHLNRCSSCSDQQEARALFAQFVPRLAQQGRLRIICSDINRVEPQVLIAVVGAVDTPQVLWLEGDRPTPRRRGEAPAAAAARVVAVLDAAAAAAASADTPMVYIHRKGPSYADDAAYADWLAARSDGSDPSPPEDTLPVAASAGDVARCWRWCADFPLAHGTAKGLNTAGAPGRLALQELCAKVTARGPEGAPVEVEAGGQKLSCGRRTGDDCGCLYLVCRQWAMWSSDAEPESSDLPVCLSTWLRHTVPPSWFAQRQLLSHRWDAAAPTAPSVACVRHRGHWWENSPSVFRAAWWLATVAGAMCGTASARAGSGVQLSPQRRSWGSYGKAMEVWLGKSLLRGAEGGMPICWADGVADHTDLDSAPDEVVVLDPEMTRQWAELQKQVAKEIVAGDGSSEAAARALFPVGSYVEASGAQSRELEGQRGTVVGYVGGRVVVAFHGRGGKRAVPSLLLRNASLPPVARVRFGCGVSDLLLPSGAVVGGRQFCRKDGVVPRMTHCAVSLADAQCDPVYCTDTGRWNSTRPTCRRRRCAIQELGLPDSARVCYGPPTGNVAVGAVCEVSTPYAHCPTVQCTEVSGKGAVWNATHLSCTPCASDTDSLYTTGEVPLTVPSGETVPRDVCACRSACAAAGAGAFSFATAVHLLNGSAAAGGCKCFLMPVAAKRVPGVVSGATGRKTTMEALEAAEEYSATGCGKGASRQVAQAWGEIAPALASAVRRLGLSDVGMAKACAAAQRRWRTGHIHGLRMATQRAVHSVDSKGAAQFTEICLENPPDVAQKTYPSKAVARLASDPLAPPAPRKIAVFAGAKDFATLQSDGTYRLGSVAEFVCGYPSGPQFDLRAFEEDEAKYGEGGLSGGVQAYPEGVDVRWARASARARGGGKLIDLASWLQRQVQPQDFVVLVCDLGGAEHELLPYLAAKGALVLVDEVFVRCVDPPDAPSGSTPKGPDQRTEECTHLRTDVLASKVPWHDW
eukprot:TRINITY_DN47284_c0_g1_i1.p1 TRINITY_DN47284_c0_g1~~TRINITY_DN47284_c0_g1_i1.p1  ORF type:complete len:1204 (+),score=341.29 TRINITY_DN47284_c0_g1_i1:104-3715(+)